MTQAFEALGKSSNRKLLTLDQSLESACSKLLDSFLRIPPAEIGTPGGAHLPYQHVAMGQKPNRTPSEHPNLTTKIGSSMGGAFCTPKWF